MERSSSNKKIQIIGYFSNCLGWKIHGKKYALTDGIGIFPHDPLLEEDEMKELINFYMKYGDSIKVTIEPYDGK